MLASVANRLAVVTIPRRIASEHERAMRGARRWLACLLALVALAALVGCGAEDEESVTPVAAAEVPGPVVGRDPIPVVHRAENNSDAFVRWRLAGLRDRIVVHLDGHIDLDWLPDETIEAIAAAGGEEALRALEAHPYDLDVPAHGTFAVWNYVYVAARTGLLREFWWVVPDGSLTRPGGFEHLRRFLIARLSGATPDQLLGLRFEQGVASGTILGVPLRIVELARLPAFPEPVVLDLDADYFGTADAATQALRPLPARPVAEVMRLLAARGLRADFATVSSSNVGGYLPIHMRIDADEAELWLRDPDAARRREEEIGARLLDARRAMGLFDHAGAAESLAGLRRVRPDEAALAFLHYEALAAAGDAEASEEAFGAAVQADPIYAHADLFTADALRLQGRYDEALVLYRRVESTVPPEWQGYVRRRVGTSLLVLDRLPEAEQVLREVVEAHPAHADSWSQLGRAVLDQGRTDEALHLVGEAWRRDPWNGHHPRLIAAALTRKERMAEAFEPALAAARLRPSDVEVLKNVGLLLAATGRLAESRPPLETAIKLAPDDADAMVVLGNVHLRTGDTEAAVRVFQDALKLQPGNPHAQAGLAQAGG